MRANLYHHGWHSWLTYGLPSSLLVLVGKFYDRQPWFLLQASGSGTATRSSGSDAFLPCDISTWYTQININQINLGSNQANKWATLRRQCKCNMHMAHTAQSWLLLSCFSQMEYKKSRQNAMRVMSSAKEKEQKEWANDLNDSECQNKIFRRAKQMVKERQDITVCWWLGCGSWNRRGAD